MRRCAFVLGLALAGAVAAAEPPRRIVSTSPSITETLFALGLGDRIVGVSRFCRYPPTVATLPRVGTFLNPDVEAIARLSPDLVAVHGSSHDVEGRLAALQLRSVTVERGGLASIYAAIRGLGEAAGVSVNATALVGQIQARLAGLREKTATLPHPKVLLILGRRPGTLSDIVAVGRDSYLNELIEIAGGVNVLAAAGLPEYPRISLETVIRLQPDVLIDTAGMGETPEERERSGRAAQELWRGNALVAATRMRIHTKTTDALVVPGPRVVETAEWLTALLHEGAAP
jgi:iron complex transport system substrate-binding protein